MAHSRVGEFYSDNSDEKDSQIQPMEIDNTRTLRTDYRIWFESLPPSWRQCLHIRDEKKALGDIRYFETLSSGLDDVIEDLKRVISNEQSKPTYPHISDVNDESFDRIVNDAAKDIVKNRKRHTQSNVSICDEMQLKMSECIEKKKEIIQMLEDIERKNGKPDDVSLANWLILPDVTRRQIHSIEKDHQPKYLIDLYATLLKDYLKLQGTRKDMHELERQNTLLVEKNIEIQKKRADMSLVIDKQKGYIMDGNAQLKKYETDINRLKSRLEKQARENNPDYIRHLQKLSAQSQTKVKELSEENEYLKEEKQKLLTRLSEVAGEKLTRNNPAITDLSDEHRPIKLAERFNQMYDDMWTDALEEFTKHGIEEVCSVQFLLKIVMSAFRFSCDTSVLLDVSTCERILLIDENEHPSISTFATKTMETKTMEDGKTSLAQMIQGIKSSNDKKILLTAVKRFTTILEKMIETFLEDHRPHEKLPEFLQESEVSSSSSDNPASGILGRLEPKDSKSAKPQFSQSMHCIIENKPCQKGRLTRSSKPDFSTSLHDRSTDIKTIILNVDQTVKKEQIHSDHTVSNQRQCFHEFPLTLSFAKYCVELCWRMRANSPPIDLDSTVPNDCKFNNDIYKAYTRSGVEVEYVVWPAMYLCKDGPLLSKGVAQARPK